MADEHLRPGDTIIIHENYEDLKAGDHLLVDEVDKDGMVWIVLSNGTDSAGFDPDEYYLVKRRYEIQFSSIDVETFQRD